MEEGSVEMLEFLFGRKGKNPPKDVLINEIYTKLSDHFGVKNISDERNTYLKNIMLNHGYLNLPSLNIWLSIHLY